MFATGGWREDAACLDVPSEVFFPEIGNLENHERLAELTSRALSICGSCPVVSDCRNFVREAGAAIPYGVWGGLTAKQRRQERRNPHTNGTPPSSLLSDTHSSFIWDTIDWSASQPPKTAKPA